jgi:hypothetical protein
LLVVWLDGRLVVGWLICSFPPPHTLIPVVLDVSDFTGAFYLPFWIMVLPVETVMVRSVPVAGWFGYLDRLVRCWLPTILVGVHVVDTTVTTLRTDGLRVLDQLLVLHTRTFLHTYSRYAHTIILRTVRWTLPYFMVRLRALGRACGVNVHYCCQTCTLLSFIVVQFNWVPLLLRWW